MSWAGASRGLLRGDALNGEDKALARDGVEPWAVEARAKTRDPERRRKIAASAS